MSQILIAAHGNSLRGIVKHLDGLSDEQIMKLNLPTGNFPLKQFYFLLTCFHVGIPFVYELDADMKPVKSMQFLGDEEMVRKAMESVAAQGKAKPAAAAPAAPAAPEAAAAAPAPAAAAEAPAPAAPAAAPANEEKKAGQTAK